MRRVKYPKIGVDCPTKKNHYIYRMKQRKTFIFFVINTLFLCASFGQFTAKISDFAKTPFLEFEHKQTYVLPTNRGFWKFSDSGFSFYYSNTNALPNKTFEVKFIQPNHSRKFIQPNFLPQKYIYHFPNKHLSGTTDLIVQNLYQNIDLLLHSAKHGQFKYSLVVHPKANLKDIQIQYLFKGQIVTPEIFENTFLKWQNSEFQYAEFGLNAFTPNSKVPIEYTSVNSIIGFNVPQKSLNLKNATLTIDPWVKFIDTLKISNPYSNKLFENMAVDVEHDNAGNTYIYGGAVNWLDIPRVAKYDTKGNLKWVFLGTINIDNYYQFSLEIYGGGINSFTVNRYENKIYVGPHSSRNVGNAEFVSLDTNGLWDSAYHSIHSIFYRGSFFTKCTDKQSRWVQGCDWSGYTSNWDQILYGKISDTCKNCFKAISPDTVKFAAIKIVLDDDDQAFINYNGGLGPRHTWKFKYSSYITEHLNIIASLNDSLSKEKWNHRNPEWIIGVATKSNHNPNPEGYGQGVILHCLGVNSRYLCYYDGKRYQVFNKHNGKLILFDSFPNKIIRVQSGVYVDNCDNLYLGFDSARIKVFKITPTKLVPIHTYKLVKENNYKVNDIRYNNITKKLHFCADSLVGVIDSLIGCTPVETKIVIDSSLICQNKSIVKIHNPLPNKKYRIIWENQTKNDTIKQVVYKQGNSDSIDIVDTLFNRDPKAKYKVSGVMYQACFDSPLTPVTIFPYHFSDTNLAFSGCLNDTFKVNSKLYFKSGTFYDTLKNHCQCDSVLKINIAIHNDTAVSQKYDICKGDSIWFGGKVYTSNSTHVDSFFTVFGCDSIVTRNIVVKPIYDTSWHEYLCKNQVYSYRNKNYIAPNFIYDTITAQNGCDSTVKIQLHLSALKSDFDIDSSKVPEFSFFQKSMNHVSFIWHFGDGQFDTSTQHPSKTFKNIIDSTYNICLISTDSLGCKDTLCKRVNVYSLKYFLYNTFTPNQDGFNDQFVIGYNHVPFKYDIQIFTRWGTLVYQNDKADINDNQSFWNGKVHNIGAECPSGSYFVLYKFYLNGTENAPKQVNGVITLIR